MSDSLREAADRICAGEDPETVAADYPGLMIHLSRRSTCEHVYDGPGVEFDLDGGGGGWTATCSKCGAHAIDDRSIWDDLP